MVDLMLKRLRDNGIMIYCLVRVFLLCNSGPEEVCVAPNLRESCRPPPLTRIIINTRSSRLRFLNTTFVCRILRVSSNPVGPMRPVGFLDPRNAETNAPLFTASSIYTLPRRSPSILYLSHY